MELRPGMIVQHFKRETLDEESRKSNKYLYRIVGIGQHTETKEQCVVYQALYSDPKADIFFGLYIRPYDMFMSEVDHEKYPDIKQKYKFEPYWGD